MVFEKGMYADSWTPLPSNSGMNFCTLAGTCFELDNPMMAHNNNILFWKQGNESIPDLPSLPAVCRLGESPPTRGK